MCFLWENTLKIYGSRQSYVCSGTSVATCCVVSANILYIFVDLIHDARHFCTRINCLLDNSKHRSRAISRLSEGRKIHVLSCNIDYRDRPESMFAFTTQHVVIEVPECTLDCPETKNLEKTFLLKTHRNIHDEGKR